MKKLFLLILIIFGLFLWFKKSGESLPYFQVIFFDVGQGDATLIITPNLQTILIDGGPDRKVLRELGNFLSFWHRKIDLLVVTHAHDDHFIGLIETISRYQVEKILISKSETKNSAWLNLQNSIKSKRVDVINPEEGVIFKFDSGCYLKVLSSHNIIRTDENDHSVVLKFSCLEKNILLAGDASELVEKELLGRGVNLKANIFKVSHHGSQTSNSEAFIEAISPHLAVISAGLNNKFKHPNSNILDRLRKMSVDIYQTMTSGSRHFLANNNEIILIK